MRLARLALIVLLLAAAMLACTLGGRTDPTSANSAAGQATLTYAADAWFTQLTAIAAQATPIP